MTGNTRTIEQRIANYRSCLDEAIDSRPGAATITEVTESGIGGVDVIDFDREVLDEDRRINWARIGYVAAALALCVGAAVSYGIASSTDRIGESDVAAGPASTINGAAPDACPGADDSELGSPLPELDYSTPGFIVALPAGTPAQTLAVRALLNPRAGQNCLAYDPATARTTFNSSTNTVSITTQSSPAAGELDISLTFGESSGLVGVTAISGRTEFVVDAFDSTTPILRFTGGMPDDATSMTLRLQKGSQSWSLELPLTESNSTLIELPSSEVDIQPDTPFSSITFTLFNPEGQAVDAGGIILN